jgi:hypothetical protein
MKRIITMMAVALAAALIAGGCASAPGVPQGSVLMGDYQGRFNSQYSWGNIKIRLYEAPDGSRPVSGQLNPEAGTIMGVFRGQMNGSRLEGQFLEANGTITGELSPDGNSMSGTFSFPNVLGPPGTWTAQKQ